MEAMTSGSSGRLTITYSSVTHTIVAEYNGKDLMATCRQNGRVLFAYLVHKRGHGCPYTDIDAALFHIGSLGGPEAVSDARTELLDCLFPTRLKRRGGRSQPPMSYPSDCRETLFTISKPNIRCLKLTIDSDNLVEISDTAKPNESSSTSFNPLHNETITVYLGARDTHVCLIDGNGIVPYEVNNIICRRYGRELHPPSELLPAIEAYQTEQDRLKAQSLPYAWNGKIAHIERFNVTRTPNDESPVLDMTIRTAEYYHFMVTTGALYEDYTANGYASPLRQKLLGVFDDWRFSTPPNIVNGLPVNLLIATSDNQLVFSKRSATVALAPNVITATVNENLHPDHDYIGDNQYDFNTLVQRGLKQEIGWNGFEKTGAEVFILLFLIDVARVSYGITGYVRLPITTSELVALFNKRCGDRPETQYFIPVPFTTKGVCKFVHSNDLYNAIGITGIYSLLHRGASMEDINHEFHNLQSENEAESSS